MIIHRITNAVVRSQSQTRARLLVCRAVGSIEEVAIPEIGVVLGAHAGCDVRLDDPMVSGRHVSIAPTSGGFEVRDLGSKNGTWLDQVQVQHATVAVGSVIRVGTTIVQLLPADEVVDVEPSAASSFGGLVGDSLAMRRIYAVLERASASPAPILLLGESGTGKELAARAVHDNSPRSKGPFVVFDCGAATESLVESELFGHRRGAFTGATADRLGAFARAHEGTLFLDEIGDLPLALQPKLLRMLERGEVTPLGATRSEMHDVRFVAATHRNLWDEVARGNFRADLYYRLAVVEIHLPPLRHRTSDIAELARSFLRQNSRSDAGVEGPALARLEGYAWPGNVRELRNVIARASALASKEAEFAQMPIALRPREAAEVPKLASADVPYHEAKDKLLARFDAEYFADLLRRVPDNMAQAAREAGLERKYLYRLLERAGLLKVRPRDGEG